MNKSEIDDAGIAAGRALVDAPLIISDEDRQRLEEAWNDMAAYNAAMDVDVVTAGYVPKPTVDPNRTLLPSFLEIMKLPRWARVAFAARCARRVLPIVRKLWTTPAIRDLRALEKAVSVAARCAATAGADAGDTYDAAQAAWGISDLYAKQAAEAAARAGQAASAARGDVNDFYWGVENAVMSLCGVITVGTVRDLAAPACDFDRVRQTAEREKWTDDTPVPQSVFGPMWEGPPPAWWTDDILAGLPPEPAAELNKPNQEHEQPTDGAPAAP